MLLPRACGVLLHPTSLPGPGGIGDLGEEAYRFVDWLGAAGQSFWQVLPLGPTGYGDSPYQCFSAFAGNPLLISLERLVADGALAPALVAAAPRFPPGRVDYGAVIPFKLGRLRQAGENLAAWPVPLRAEFAAFCAAQASWLDDYALFMALKEAHGGAPWVQWEEELVQRQLPALAAARAALATAVTTHQAMQFFFARQWRALREYANAQGVSLIGDMPIFLAHDSAEVWLHQELFYLDEHGRPTVVAGVPPDYFSATGQLWGNPLYRWKRMAADGYAWWVERIRAGLALMNYVRLDHFRGFQAYWEVPGDATTAANGHWVKGPGAALFRALEKALGELPIIAEDLGLITPAVVALRDQLGLPGMVVLQFAFAADATNTHLPHRWREHCLAYTGTHDNDTTVGWYKRVATTPEGHYARRYLGVNGHDIAWDLVRVALASVATLAIYPAQDLLSLGNEARMNHPSTAGGNWSWRLQAGALNEAIAARLRQMTIDYGRLPAAEESTAESAEGAEVEKG